MTTVGTPLKRAILAPRANPELYDVNYVKMRITYNAQGKRVEVAFFDTTEQPIKNKEAGYAKVTFSYNLQGNLTEVAFFDEQDQPIMRKGKAAKLRRTYNAHDQLIQETLYDQHGTPLPRVRLRHRCWVLARGGYRIEPPPTRRPPQWSPMVWR
jgi:YD repeat-containing protein